MGNKRTYVPLQMEVLSYPVSPFVTCSSSGDFPIPWIGGSGDVPIFSIMKRACNQVAASYKEDCGLRSFGFRMFWCESLHV